MSIKARRYDNTPAPEQPPHPDTLTVNVSPLALADGESDDYILRECTLCPVRQACIRAVLALRPFALADCNAAARQSGKRRARLARNIPMTERILALLRETPGLTYHEIAARLGVDGERARNLIAQLYRVGPRIRSELTGHCTPARYYAL